MTFIVMPEKRIRKTACMILMMSSLIFSVTGMDAYFQRFDAAKKVLEGVLEEARECNGKIGKTQAQGEELPRADDDPEEDDGFGIRYDASVLGDARLNEMDKFQVQTMQKLRQDHRQLLHRFGTALKTKDAEIDKLKILAQSLLEANKALEENACRLQLERNDRNIRFSHYFKKSNDEKERIDDDVEAWRVWAKSSFQEIECLATEATKLKTIKCSPDSGNQEDKVGLVEHRTVKDLMKKILDVCKDATGSDDKEDDAPPFEPLSLTKGRSWEERIKRLRSDKTARSDSDSSSNSGQSKPL